MKVVMVGTGYVGLTQGAVFAEAGHEVYAHDIDVVRIAAYNTGRREEIEKYVTEAGLVSSIQETLNRHLFFTTDLVTAVDGAQLIFMCVNTPANTDGSSDLSFYINAARQLAELLKSRKETTRVVVANKSTVPIGTARMLESILAEYGVANVGVASNPEFLAQGNAIEGARRPDKIVIGADTVEDYKVFRHLYSQFWNHVSIRYVETTPETAEAIKYVSNMILLSYVSFWNGVGARIGEAFDNIRMEDLRVGVTADKRISTWGSYVSNGAGGSCLGKDSLSLINQLRQAGQPTQLLEAIYNINERQKAYMIDRAVNEAKFSFNNRRVALLGLAFKKRTDDMRDSASLKAIELFLSKGVASIRAYDPWARQRAMQWLNPAKNHLYEKISYHESAEEAIQASDALYISTDWEEFRGLSTIIERCAKPPYLIIDARRMIPDYLELIEKGYSYLPVGGKFLKAK